MIILASNKIYHMKFSLLLGLLLLSSTGQAQQMKSPKLVVGIVVDQMCYEYLYRYYDKFCDGGFRKLMTDGTNCRNTQYNYLPTYTGPGHASIYTGTTPSNHGIVANDWFDMTTKKSVNCVEDSTVNPVGTTSSYGYFSPMNLKANTITDQLKLTYPEAKVVSMSIKNRGAILPGGHLSNGSYWYDFDSGKFITSSFFKKELPSWVNAFNDEKHPENYLKKEWNTIMDIDLYAESGPDDSPYEHLLPGKTTPTFPYDLKEMTQGIPNYELFTYTPFANTFLTDFALKSVESEKLGQDGQTDMLCISYSTPDIAGHAFGPYSIELQDIYLRLDLEIQKLISQLEKQLGKGEFTLFLTADHAVVPVPQYLTDKNLPGGYFFKSEKMMSLGALVALEFGKNYILSEDNMNIYLDKDQMAADNVSKKNVVSFIANEVQSWENVKRVFTGDQLYNNSVDDGWMDMVRRGYHHSESGDIIFMLEPGFLPKTSDSELTRKGTSHGSAFNYDTHVPLLWYGKGIPSQEILRKVNVTDIAATLAHLLYLQMPNSTTGAPILEIFK